MKIILACCLMSLPLKQLSLTSNYGYRLHPVTGKYAMHRGIDLRAQHDTVYAILDGYVRAIAYDRNLGVFIRLGHSKIQSLYGHLSVVFVVPGETVSSGDPIGITGSTGRVTGEHLHFGIIYQQQSIDPLQFLHDYLIINNNEQ